MAEHRAAIARCASNHHSAHITILLRAIIYTCLLRHVPVPGLHPVALIREPLLHLFRNKH
jgi:hypothetical protein